MRPAARPRDGGGFRWRRLLRIRNKLLVVNALLAVVPIAGLSFARTFERELLRSEEESMVALATGLAAAEAAAESADESSRATARATVEGAARASATTLRARVWLLDARGVISFDTGAEQIELVTRGTRLLSDEESSRSPLTRERVVADPLPDGGSFGERPEVKAALAGRPGRATRVSSRLRAVRLYVAEPVRGGAGVVYVSRTTYPVLVSLYRVRNGLERVALVALAAGLVVAVFLALTISRPLGLLTGAARRIAAGERGVVLGHGGYDEIGDLARAFDAMARELDARLSYISELAANVSHEFKTPLASVRGAAELLREGAADDPVARERFLDNILRDTERLARLVSRLLELSRIEARVERATVIDYADLIERVVARYRSAGHRVFGHYEARHAHVRGVADQLAGAVANLLDNAIRFSPDGAPVELRVEGQGDALLTRVVDQGHGISPANLPHVWERFFTTARGGGGTGLGLAIVRATVEGHGGRVGVESELGVGSTFWFALPRGL